MTSLLISTSKGLSEPLAIERVMGVPTSPRIVSTASFNVISITETPLMCVI